MFVRPGSRSWFRRLCGSSGDLGLFAEEVTGEGMMLGNFPQAFTHLALIEAAANLRDAAHTEALHIWARHRDVRGPHAEHERG